MRTGFGVSNLERWCCVTVGCVIQDFRFTGFQIGSRCRGGVGGFEDYGFTSLSS